MNSISSAFCRFALLAFVVWQASAQDAASPAPLADYEVGYTEFRTNLPGGRHANVTTMRAHLVRADGSDRRVIAESLAREPYTLTQFAGWSPDGQYALIGSAWESPENAAWEEEHKSFRMTEGWRYDTCLVDPETGAIENLTAVDRVSDYNTGLFFFPGEEGKLGFQALIGGMSHPFVMNRDGSNKRDVSSGAEGFAYGYSASPDGTRIAYHKDYQIYVADADGANPVHVETGNPFNFVPQWSPDGNWLLFVSGEHYNCHPYLARPDGTELRKLADRNGYEGVIAFLDVEDFHGGSSDVPVWCKDGRWVYFTAAVEDRVELMRVSLDGAIEQLTQSPPGTKVYHPTPSPDGRWLVFGSNQTGTRQLYAMPAGGGAAQPITQVPEGSGAMWPHWRPR